MQKIIEQLIEEIESYVCKDKKDLAYSWILISPEKWAKLKRKYLHKQKFPPEGK